MALQSIHPEQLRFMYMYTVGVCTCTLCRYRIKTIGKKYLNLGKCTSHTYNVHVRSIHAVSQR